MANIKARDLFELQHLSKNFGQSQNNENLTEEAREMVTEINLALVDKTIDLKCLSRLYSELSEVADDHFANICRQLSDLLIDIEK